jgi:hypothetical protein
MPKTRWLSWLSGGSPEASFSARSCLGLPGASVSLGQFSGWATLAGHSGLGFDIELDQRELLPSHEQRMYPHYRLPGGVDAGAVRGAL